MKQPIGGLAAAFAFFSVATPASAEEAKLRVVDVGAGLCVIAIAPGNGVMVYDTGAGAKRCGDAVEEITSGAEIDLMVLSHSDIDHIGAARRILAANSVRTIIHPGDTRSGVTIRKVRTDIANEPGTTIWDLGNRSLPFGTKFPVGDATVTFVAGWSNPRDIYGDDPSLDSSSYDAERYNGISLVVRFEYGGHSVLLTGDTLGRIEGSRRDETLCQYAEREMVANVSAVPIESDVLIGQHHGSDDSSSNCFIRAVKPEWVVFSAGHEYNHPRQSAADRFLSYGVDKDKMLRTDRGDNEKGKGRGKEWVYGGLRGCVDKEGDDDVEIKLPSSAANPAEVSYRARKTGC